MHYRPHYITLLGFERLTYIFTLAAHVEGIQVFEMSDYYDVDAVGRELSEMYIGVALVSDRGGRGMCKIFFRQIQCENLLLNISHVFSRYLLRRVPNFTNQTALIEPRKN